MCADRPLWGLLPLVGWVLGAVSPGVLCRFVREKMDGARYLASALGLLIVKFFRLIVAMVVLPVAIAGALDTRALCRSAFVVVGAITILVAVNVPTLLLAIVVRAMSGVASGNLAFCLVGTTFILMSTNLITKPVFELELSLFFNTLELHAFELTVVFVPHELGFKKLNDQF